MSQYSGLCDGDNNPHPPKCAVVILDFDITGQNSCRQQIRVIESPDDQCESDPLVTSVVMKHDGWKDGWMEGRMVPVPIVPWTLLG